MVFSNSESGCRLFCLAECDNEKMNLSHPEYYLSDILSAMETRGEINIHNSDSIENDGIKKRITFPANLYIIGTINIDETTRELSPRLKSRAFVVELKADFKNFIANSTDEDEKRVAEILQVIEDCLAKIDLGFGKLERLKEKFDSQGFV